MQEILRTEQSNSQSIEKLSLEDWESDAFHIRDEIEKQLKTIDLTQERIGLNYTGGTKAMAVHAYRAIFDRDPKAVFSYLDPRRLEMCIDNQDGDRTRIKVTPDLLGIKLKQLFTLHGLQLEKPPTRQGILPEVANAIAQLFHQGQEKQKQWTEWRTKVLLEALRNKKQETRKYDWKLNPLDIPIALHWSQEIIDSFEEEGVIKERKILLLHEMAKSDYFQDLEDFGKWIDGTWMETHVLHQVASVAHEYYIQDFGANFELPLPGTTDGFEFDVAFMRGYQLFALSCTAKSDRADCKKKLFEANLRAEQMGGSESRVALVCCSEKPDSIKAEMTHLARGNRIAVFGREDLLHLRKGISQWIEANDREAKKA